MQMTNIQIAALVRYIVANEKESYERNGSEDGILGGWKIPSIRKLREFISFELRDAKNLVDATEISSDPIIRVLEEMQSRDE